MSQLHEEIIPSHHIETVREKMIGFPSVVLELTEQEIARNPGADKLEVMRTYRDELNRRLGMTMLTAEVLE